MILTEDFKFTLGQQAALWLIAGACLLPAIFYGLYWAIKRKLNWVAVVVGIVVGALTAIAPHTANNIIGRAIWMAAEQVVAMYICLRIIGSHNETLGTPIGLGLGWSMFPLFVMQGWNALNTVAAVQLFNEMGLTELLAGIPSVQHEEFRATIEAIATQPVQDFIFMALKCACMFIITVGTCRLIWYSLKGGRREPHWGFIVIAIILRIPAETFSQLTDSIAAQCAYYAMSVAILVLSIFAAKLWDTPDKYKDRLTRKKM